ncbi:hypothetical protein P389DRAFT_207487 [Cystobasidium minutum MCA 4210]|uniref:uncharacterized protein n=1 Tax=Cystobasidium minutum MCA 4210 TaxID=1397322 RepID=UPI0034CE3406|eukprot:jgi/Rhomi1/207487/estExt_Genemark1.C_1_t10396
MPPPPLLDPPLYPAYILEVGSSVISSSLAQDAEDLVALDTKAWTAKKITIFKEPSFTVWKPFVLSKEHQLNKSTHAFTSPLFSWKAARLEEVLSSIIQDPGLVFGLPGAPSKLDAIENFDQDGWIKETVTTIDRNDIHVKFAPSGPADMQGKNTLALRMCLGSFICVLARDHNDYQRLHPGKNIWLLVSTIRVRDIALYRKFKEALELAGMANIGIITDNLLGIERKEAMDEATMAFCGSCLKLDKTHLRCGGCKVAYYCSPACQRADWKARHKQECPERQKDQEDWNNTLISLGHRKL